MIGESMCLRLKWLACITMLVAAIAIPFGAFAAPQNASLNGRVTDAFGAALPNAQVALVPPAPIMPNMTMAPPPPIPGRVNADGSFSFTGIAPGSYVLQVDAPGFERSSQPVTLPTNQTFNVKLDVLDIPGAETTTRPPGQT